MENQLMPGQASKGGRPPFSLEKWLYRALSDNTVGCESVPLSWSHKKFPAFRKGDCEHIIAFSNDAHEVSLGTPHQYDMQIRREIFHKMIRWYLGQWIFREWLGVRRWLWYRLLFRRVRGFKPPTLSLKENV